MNPKGSSSAQRELVFDPDFVEDLRYWIDTERKTAARLLELVEAVRRDPFGGLGKPEPLKYLAPGAWSRRLTREHRMVYLVSESKVTFLQARFHY